MASISYAMIFFGMMHLLNGMKMEHAFSPQAIGEVGLEFRGSPGQEAAEGQENVKDGVVQFANGVNRFKDNKELSSAEAVLEKIALGLQAVDASKMPKPKQRTRSNSMQMDMGVLDEGTEPLEATESEDELVSARTTSLARSQISGTGSQKLVALVFLIAAFQMAFTFFAEREAKRLWEYVLPSKVDDVPVVDVDEVELVELEQVPKLLSLPEGHPALSERSASEAQELSVTDLLQTQEAVDEDRPEEQEVLKSVCSMPDGANQPNAPLDIQ